jgi:hypothetical protein
VPPEGSSTMVILAMHVVGDASANRREPGSGSHRKEPAPGHEQPDDFGERRSTFTFENARPLIERSESRHSRSIEKRLPVVETDIAIAAPESTRQHETGSVHEIEHHSRRARRNPPAPRLVAHIAANTTSTISAPTT